MSKSEKSNNTRPVLFENHIIFRKSLKIWVFFPIFLILFVADVVSKVYVEQNYLTSNAEWIIENWFLVKLTYNPGLNFGLLAKNKIASIVISILFSTGIFFLFIFTTRGLLLTTLLFIFVGGFANAFSRMLTEKFEVVDFIVFSRLKTVSNNVYAFNFADVYVSVGAGLFLIHILVVLIETIVVIFKSREKKALYYKKSSDLLKLRTDYEEQLVWPWLFIKYDTSRQEYLTKKQLILNEYKLGLEEIKQRKANARAKK